MSDRIVIYCVMAKESLDAMKGVRGKMIAQGGHGFLHAFWDAEERFPDHARAYRESERAYKITLVAPTVADLEALQTAYRDKCGVSLVRDAGLTVFEGPTVTCLGIGPIPSDLVGQDLKDLRTLT